jgi:bifunctional N-acetylglucosamine-1-phosphate-uridyltransferase/glucosamine-1-phosphate-acetyltransferase GlmU-like protein
MEHVFENNLLWDEYNSLSPRKIWEKQRDLVLIMAGNSDLPKVLYELNGLPLIVHIVKSALHIDSTSIIYIIVGKYREQIEKVINEHFMKSDYIRYINQPEPLGTIQCCLPVLQQYFPSSKVLILSGDMPFFSTHSMREVMKNQFAATIVAGHMEEPYGYGRIIQSHQQSHQQSQPSAFRIVEEKDCTDEEKLVKLVNCGIYAFENGFLCKNLPKINNNNVQQEYCLTSIFSGGGEEQIGLFEIPVDEINTLEEMRSKTI